MKRLFALLFVATLIAPVGFAQEGVRSPAAPVEPTLAQRLDAVEAQLQAWIPPEDPRAASGADSTPFPTWKVTGFFQLDSGFYAQSGRNRATLGGSTSETFAVRGQIDF